MKVTTEMIASLGAGGQLDALVAEHVMGMLWVNIPPPTDQSAWPVNVLIEPEELPAWQSLYPDLSQGLSTADEARTSLGGVRYSSDIAHAWRVVEQMKKREAEGTCGPLWWNFWQSGYIHIWELPAAEASLNICRAALASVVVEVPSFEEVSAKIAEIYKRNAA